MSLEQVNVEIDSSLLDQVFEKAGRKAKKRLVVEEALKEWLAKRVDERWKAGAVCLNKAVACEANHPQLMPEVNDPRPVVTPAKDYTKNFLKTK